MLAVSDYSGIVDIYISNIVTSLWDAQFTPASTITTPFITTTIRPERDGLALLIDTSGNVYLLAMGDESGYNCGANLYSVYEVDKPANSIRAIELSKYKLNTKQGYYLGAYGVRGRWGTSLNIDSPTQLTILVTERAIGTGYTDLNYFSINKK